MVKREKKENWFFPLLFIIFGIFLIFHLIIQKYTAYFVTEEDSFSNLNYPHYSHKEITYRLKHMDICFEGQANRTKLAFEKVQESTNNLIQFKEVEGYADIVVDCINLGEQVRQFSLNQTCEEKKIPLESSSQDIAEYRENLSQYKEELSSKNMYVYPNKIRVSGDGKFLTSRICFVNKSKFEYDPEMIFDRLPEVTNDGLFLHRETTEGLTISNRDGFLIFNVSIELYKNTPICENFPSVEVHELLHAMGFDHHIGKEDIMDPYFTNCNERNKVNDKYANCLRYIYSNTKEGECYDVNFMASE